jgi:hypothetical protein
LVDVVWSVVVSVVLSVVRVALGFAAQAMQASHVGRLQRGGPAGGAPLAESRDAFGPFAAHALRKALRGVVEPGTEARVK